MTLEWRVAVTFHMQFKFAQKKCANQPVHLDSFYMLINLVDMVTEAGNEISKAVIQQVATMANAHLLYVTGLEVAFQYSLSNMARIFFYVQERQLRESEQDRLIYTKLSYAGTASEVDLPGKSSSSGLGPRTYFTISGKFGPLCQKLKLLVYLIYKNNTYSMC